VRAAARIALRSDAFAMPFTFATSSQSCTSPTRRFREGQGPFRVVDPGLSPTVRCQPFAVLARHEGGRRPLHDHTATPHPPRGRSPKVEPPVPDELEVVIESSHRRSPATRGRFSHACTRTAPPARTARSASPRAFEDPRACLPAMSRSSACDRARPTGAAHPRRQGRGRTSSSRFPSPHPGKPVEPASPPAHSREARDGGRRSPRAQRRPSACGPLRRDAPQGPKTAPVPKRVGRSIPMSPAKPRRGCPRPPLAPLGFTSSLSSTAPALTPLCSYSSKPNTGRLPTPHTYEP